MGCLHGHVALLSADFPQNNKESFILARGCIREAWHPFHLKYNFTASFCCNCFQTEEINIQWMQQFHWASPQLHVRKQKAQQIQMPAQAEGFWYCCKELSWIFLIKSSVSTVHSSSTLTELPKYLQVCNQHFAAVYYSGLVCVLKSVIGGDVCYHILKRYPPLLWHRLTTFKKSKKSPHT